MESKRLTERQKRPPYEVCKFCKRKTVAPEKIGDRWRSPPLKKCNNCIALQSRTCNDLNVNRKILIKSRKEEQAVFPLLILDMMYCNLIGIYNDFKQLRRNLNKHLEDYPKSKIKIIDRKYHDFTDYIIFPS